MKKAVSKKLEVTRRKVSKLWQHYRTEKKKILSKKRLPLDLKRGLLLEQREVTKKNISVKYEDYRGYKFGVSHKSEFPDFSYSKKHVTANTTQEFFTARKNYNEGNLDRLIPKILDRPGVIGVGVIFRVKDEDTELVHHVSDFITKGLVRKLQEKNISIYDHISDKLKYSKSVQEYELKNISIRIIYEKSKSSK
jgi:hypothetical protein